MKVLGGFSDCLRDPVKNPRPAGCTGESCGWDFSAQGALLSLRPPFWGRPHCRVAACFLSTNYFIHQASLHLANEMFTVIGMWWPDPLVTSLYKVFISHSLNAIGSRAKMIFLLKSSPSQSDFIVRFAFLALRQLKSLKAIRPRKIKNNFKLFLFMANSWSSVKCYKGRVLFFPPTCL